MSWMSGKLAVLTKQVLSLVALMQQTAASKDHSAINWRLLLVQLLNLQMAACRW